jgi:hypothetical protein
VASFDIVTGLAGVDCNDTVPCAAEGCATCFDVDANHPLWPDGPFLCHEHEPQRSQLPRKLASVACKLSSVAFKAAFKAVLCRYAQTFKSLAEYDRAEPSSPRAPLRHKPQVR